jgi:hypothetical protein
LEVPPAGARGPAPKEKKTYKSWQHSVVEWRKTVAGAKKAGIIEAMEAKGRNGSVKKVIAMLLMAVLTVGTLVGCSNPEKDIIGKWVRAIDSTETYSYSIYEDSSKQERQEAIELALDGGTYQEFFEDGTVIEYFRGEYSGESTYTIEGDVLTVFSEYEGIPVQGEYTIKGSDDIYIHEIALYMIKAE